MSIHSWASSSKKLTSSFSAVSSLPALEIGELTNGLAERDGVWVDKEGNVHVANVSTNVVEFKKGGSSPDCTYTGATDPINVTTDAKGNVYIADLLGGFVDEYAQCSNTIEKQFPADDAQGVAVDKSGDLFVSYGGSSLEEFKCGSTTGTPLDASVGEGSRYLLTVAPNGSETLIVAVGEPPAGYL
jgi:hypothetical protein